MTYTIPSLKPPYYVNNKHDRMITKCDTLAQARIKAAYFNCPIIRDSNDRIVATLKVRL